MQNNNQHVLRQLRKITFALIAFAILLASYIVYFEWGRSWLDTRQAQTRQETIDWAVATIESQLVPIPIEQSPVPPAQSADEIAKREATMVAMARVDGAADAQATASANALQQVTLVAMETSQAIAVSEARSTAFFEAESTSVAQMNATVAAYREQYDSFLQAQVMATVQASYQSDIETVTAAGTYRTRLVLTFVFAFALGNASLFFGMMYFSRPKRKTRRVVGENQLVPISQQFSTVPCGCNGRPVNCRTCDGTGEVLQFDNESNQHLYYECHNCRGVGKVKCGQCFGEGSVYRRNLSEYTIR